MASQKRDQQISENQNPSSALFKEIIESIKSDTSIDKGMNKGASERVDNNPGLLFIESLNNEQEINEKTPEILNTLIQNSVYKFYHWGSFNQLKTVANIFEKISQNQNFNKIESEFNLFVTEIEKAIAINNLDVKSKPNYEYARRDYSVRIFECTEILKKISKIEAEHL